MRELWNTLSQEMKPRFHEISAYLIALALCWLIVFHPKLRMGLLVFFTGFGSMSPFFVLLGLIFSGGLLLSLVHVFIKRKKSTTEKFLIGWFLLGASLVGSFFLGSEMLRSRSSILLILAIWNILTSVVMLVQMVAHEYDISDENASLMEVFVTTSILVIILLFADLYLRYSVAMTLSICIFYSTSIVFLSGWIINNLDLRLPGIRK